MSQMPFQCLVSQCVSRGYAAHVRSGQMLLAARGSLLFVELS